MSRRARSLASNADAGSLVNFRYEIAQILKESPSLRNYLKQNYHDWYVNSVKAMQREFMIPDDNFVSLEIIMDENYFG